MDSCVFNIYTYESVVVTDVCSLKQFLWCRFESLINIACNKYDISFTSSVVICVCVYGCRTLKRKKSAAGVNKCHTVLLLQGMMK